MQVPQPWHTLEPHVYWLHHEAQYEFARTTAHVVQVEQLAALQVCSLHHEAHVGLEVEASSSKE